MHSGMTGKAVSLSICYWQTNFNWASCQNGSTLGWHYRSLSNHA